MKAKNCLPFLAIDAAPKVCPSLIDTMYCLVHLHKSIDIIRRPVHPIPLRPIKKANRNKARTNIFIFHPLIQNSSLVATPPLDRDWKLYDRLMRLETGIGGTRSLIDASEEWPMAMHNYIRKAGNEAFNTAQQESYEPTRRTNTNGAQEGPSTRPTAKHPLNISPLSAPLLLHPEISLIRRRSRSSGWFLLSDFRISVYLRLNFFRFFQISLYGFRNSMDLPPRFPHSVWIYIGFIRFLFEISLIRRRSRSDSSEAFFHKFSSRLLRSLKTYVCIGFGNKVLQVSICTATAFGSIYLTANFQKSGCGVLLPKSGERFLHLVPRWLQIWWFCAHFLWLQLLDISFDGNLLGILCGGMYYFGFLGNIIWMIWCGTVYKDFFWEICSDSKKMDHMFFVWFEEYFVMKIEDLKDVGSEFGFKILLLHNLLSGTTPIDGFIDEKGDWVYR
ncbi:hypothetical protein LXL04_011842 [Taraxacum kok-saghyz]